MTAQRLLLLDTASLYFRAFYGVPDSLRTPDGRPVNAVRGLLDFIAHLVTTYQPTHLACCWDNDWRPEWRVELIPSYKAHRVAGGGDTVVAEMATTIPGEAAPDALAAQVPMILDVLAALGLAVVGQDHYEADDVIGTLASTAPMATDVVTGDRDLFQLVDDAKPVRILYIARGVGKHEVVDEAWIRAKYGIAASAYVDYATLRGDASDGLPGVSGIGEKTAASLLTSYGDLHGILEASSRKDSPVSGGVRSKLGAAIDYLAVAPTVVSVARDLDLGVGWDDLALPAAPAHPRTFARLTEDLGLSGSAARVLAALFREA
ncbi:5'-3' exonuclease [Friedmanniella luteola]|uniref:5'-3' exonuclease n=1 Tax=Friedmanniella luteola TaxID=546871 RepID=A0A1H1U1E0_9ACTN|nr:5'-3' exonuclease [Friedmanniella luteola]SDS65709.1 5'-3' exonuclease [Friedmanniella luteola]